MKRIFNIIKFLFSRKYLFYFLLSAYLALIFVACGCSILVSCLIAGIFTVLMLKTETFFFTLLRILDTKVEQFQNWLVSFVFTHASCLFRIFVVMYIILILINIARMRHDMIAGLQNLFKAFNSLMPSAGGLNAVVVIFYVPVLGITPEGEIFIILEPCRFGIVEAIAAAGVACIAAAGAMTYSGLDDDEGRPKMITEHLAHRDVRNLLLACGAVTAGFAFFTMWWGSGPHPVAGSIPPVPPVPPVPPANAVVPNQVVTNTNVNTGIVPAESLGTALAQTTGGVGVLGGLNHIINAGDLVPNYHTGTYSFPGPSHLSSCKKFILEAITSQARYEEFFVNGRNNWATRLRENRENLLAYENIPPNISNREIKQDALLKWKVGFMDDWYELQRGFRVVYGMNQLCGPLEVLNNLNKSNNIRLLCEANPELKNFYTRFDLICQGHEMLLTRAYKKLNVRIEMMASQINGYLAHQKLIGVARPSFNVPVPLFTFAVDPTVLIIPVHSGDEFLAICEVQKFRYINLTLPVSAQSMIFEIIPYDRLSPTMKASLVKLYSKRLL